MTLPQRRSSPSTRRSPRNERGRPAPAGSLPSRVTGRPAAPVGSESPLLSRAEAAVRVECNRTASMLDSDSQVRAFAPGAPCLVSPASHATTANSIVKVPLSDYRVNAIYLTPAIFFCHSTPAAPKRKRQGQKGERKDGPPTRSIPLPQTLSPPAFARQPSRAVGPPDHGLGAHEGTGARARVISLRERNCTPRKDSARTAHCRGPAATGRPRRDGSGTSRAAGPSWSARRRCRRSAAWAWSPAASC